ncbi:MAG: glycosyltransferase family 39 protein [Ktedonobacteraceae bacterium]
MITSDRPPVTAPPLTEPARVPFIIRNVFLQKALHSSRVMLVCLLLASIGTSWFAYQTFLQPAPTTYTPDWHGAKWIQAPDGTSSVAFFRYTTNLAVLPDAAFVTIASSQVFDLFVNGYSVDTSYRDFQHGQFPQTYMYDVDSLLQPGLNIISVEVSNFNVRTPLLRMSTGFVLGKSIFYSVTGTDAWRATIRSDKVYPHVVTSSIPLGSWTTTKYDASAWPLAKTVKDSPKSAQLTFSPLLYEQPTPSNWIGIGPQDEAYFVRGFSVPPGITHAWLRLVAIGNAYVYLNGHLAFTWNSEPNSKGGLLFNPNLGTTESTILQYQGGLVDGVFDITPYLQSGVNTLAVHVTAPTSGEALAGLESLSTSMIADVLFNDSQGHQTWLLPNDTSHATSWHASPRFIDGWMQGAARAFSWPIPVVVSRPGPSGTLLLSDGTTRGIQAVPFASLVITILLCCCAVIGLCLLVSLVIVRRFFRTSKDALAMMSVAFVPALVCEGLLIVLSFEPSIDQPFPYTWEWGFVLMLILVASFILLGLNARSQNTQFSTSGSISLREGTYHLLSDHSPHVEGPKQASDSFIADVIAGLRNHWPIFLIVLLAVPLICTNLAYDPYWSDELTSIYAAKGILAHGYPVMPSGFIYPKGELYSYMLALSMLVFGDQNGAARVLSVLEYLVSLPLLYIVGTYFFNKKIAIFATAMLAFSPIALTWGRQARMYEQAQLFTILTIYLVYRALNERHRPYLVYLAIASIIVTYFSHEETFITLPAIVLWVLVTSKDEKRPSFAVLFQKHWWIAGTIGAAIIGMQLLAVRFTHPPVLGTDQSEIPFIQVSTNNVAYYLKLLFASWSFDKAVNPPVITLTSILASIGCILAFRSSDSKAKYCAWFFLCSFLTLMLVFTLRSDRYVYPIFPIYYLLAAYAVFRMFKATWALVPSHSQTLLAGTRRSVGSANRGYISAFILVGSWITAVLFAAGILLLPALPLVNYNLFVSELTGYSYHRHYADYDGIGQYMQQHWRKGDIVITINPALTTLYYTGHVDYYFSIDRALFIIEKDGRLVETATGASPLLNQSDLLAAMAPNTRIWLLSDNGPYQAAMLNRFNMPPGFHLVYEGYQSAIYVSGG